MRGSGSANHRGECMSQLVESDNLNVSHTHTTPNNTHTLT